jgi:hypothetical protein
VPDLQEYVADWTRIEERGQPHWYLVPTAAGGRLFRRRGWQGFRDAIRSAALAAGIEPGRERVVGALPRPGEPPLWPRLRPEFPSPQTDGAALGFSFGVPFELAIFNGHFPTAPIVPGAMLAGWATELAREHCGWSHGCSAVTMLKFRRIVQPGLRYQLRLTASGAGSALDFDLHEDGRLCARGSLQAASL